MENLNEYGKSRMDGKKERSGFNFAVSCYHNLGNCDTSRLWLDACFDDRDMSGKMENLNDLGKVEWPSSDGVTNFHGAIWHYTDGDGIVNRGVEEALYEFFDDRDMSEKTSEVLGDKTLVDGLAVIRDHLYAMVEGRDKEIDQLKKQNSELHTYVNDKCQEIKKLMVMLSDSGQHTGELNSEIKRLRGVISGAIKCLGGSNE